MTDISYKVMKSGLIRMYRGKERLLGPWLDMPVPLTVRKQLRSQLDPVMVRAAWLIFGTRCSPGDLNELQPYRKLVAQVMQDAPLSMPVIFAAVQGRYLTASPTRTVVRRWKDVLMQVGYESPKLSTGFSRSGRKDSDVNNFWAHLSKSAVAFTEAGWRCLAKQPLRVQRKIAKSVWTLNSTAATYDAIGKLGYGSVPAECFDLLSLTFTLVANSNYAEACAHVVRVAIKDSFELPPTTRYQQCDVVGDWLRDDQPFIEKGTRWDALVAKATTYRLEKAELDREVMQELRWAPPILPFVGAEGVVVTPFSTGEQLLDEGLQMDNCLKDTKRYAVDAVRGKSQVFGLRGVSGRATVEFRRTGVGLPWLMTQAEEAGNRPLTNTTLLRVLEGLKDKMKEAQWALEA